MSSKSFIHMKIKQEFVQFFEDFQMYEWFWNNFLYIIVSVVTWLIWRQESCFCGSFFKWLLKAKKKRFKMMCYSKTRTVFGISISKLVRNKYSFSKYNAGQCNLWLLASYTICIFWSIYMTIFPLGTPLQTRIIRNQLFLSSHLPSNPRGAPLPLLTETPHGHTEARRPIGLPQLRGLNPWEARLPRPLSPPDISVGQERTKWSPVCPYWGPLFDNQH